MNVQQLSPLLPCGGRRPLSPLLASAFRVERALPAEIEGLLRSLARRRLIPAPTYFAG